MSVIGLNLINCPDIQKKLDEGFNDRLKRTERSPGVEFLSSSLNRGGLETSVSPGAGKLKTVEYTYAPRYNNDEIATSITRTCTSTNEAGMTSFSCTVDPAVGVSVDETFNIVNLATICEGNSSYFAGRVAAMLDGCRRKMEEDIWTQIALLAGGFASNDTDGVSAGIKTISTLSGTSLVFDAISEIRYSAKQAAFTGAAYTFGSGLISKYFTATEAGCCLQDGVDISDFMGQSGIAFADAHEAQTAATNAEGFFVLEAGAVQLAKFNLYEGDMNALNTDGNRFGTITDGFTGIKFDISIQRVCEDLHVQVSLPYTLCALPDDMYSVPDRLNGVNGILEFTVTNS